MLSNEVKTLINEAIKLYSTSVLSQSVINNGAEKFVDLQTGHDPISRATYDTADTGAKAVG